VAEGQFWLAWQPIVDLASGRMTSVEALLRWDHPTLGKVSPGEFIPIAEESGLIVGIGEWVLGEACRQMSHWQREAAHLAPAIVSVNLSRVQINQGGRLLASVREVLAATGLAPTQLQLEVTEREVMQDPTGARTLMRTLKEMGVHLAMDDFGTGTSSLACLREYPFDVIKIDRAFVQGIESDADVLAMIRATVTLVEHLGMASLAEGVETAAQAATLLAIGCRYAQGYLLGRPVPAHELVLAQSPAAARTPH